MSMPGAPLARRPLHFIWMLDCSGSMNEDNKIQTLNAAIHEALPHARDVASENPNAELLMRAISFSDGARWVVPVPTPVESFTWSPISADGLTDMGAAFSMVADQLRVPPMSKRALPPVLVLVSDGGATDNWKEGLGKMMAEPWGQKAVRIAIAIGKNCDMDLLQAFIQSSEIKPLTANNPEALIRLIRWVSVEVVKSASTPASQTRNTPAPAGNVPVPPPPEVDAAEIW
jgi:uncharacterized protein YegL